MQIRIPSWLEGKPAVAPQYERQVVSDPFVQNDGVVLSSSESWDVPVGARSQLPGRGEAVEVPLVPEGSLLAGRDVTLKTGLSVHQDTRTHTLTVSQKSPEGSPKVLVEIPDDASLQLPRLSDPNPDLTITLPQRQIERIDARTGAIHLQDLVHGSESDPSSPGYIPNTISVSPGGVVEGKIWDTQDSWRHTPLNTNGFGMFENELGMAIPAHTRSAHLRELPDGSLEAQVQDSKILLRPVLSRSEVVGG